MVKEKAAKHQFVKVANVPQGSEVQGRVQTLLDEFSEKQYRQLISYADRKIAGMPLPSQSGADVVGEALSSVLVGLQSGQNGRHPRLANVTDMPAFMVYMRATVKSLIKTTLRHKHSYTFVSLDDSQSDDDEEGVDESKLELFAPTSADHDVPFRDLRSEMFGRLRARAPHYLHPLIDTWEQDAACCDNIPLDGAHRQYRAELRDLAKSVISEIEGS